MNRYSRQLLTLLWAAMLSTATLWGQIDVEHVISIGRNALYFNDYVVSIGYFNQAIDTRPWLADPYFYRAVAKVNLEDYKGAEQDASLCLDRNPFISRAYLLRGVARQNLSLTAEAIEDYRQGLRLAPDNLGMHLNLSLAQTQLKQYDEAEQSIDELLKYWAKNKDAYTLRANIALERGDTALAISRIEETLAIDSLQSMPYKMRAQILASREEFTPAIRDLSRAIDLEPREGNLYTHRGILYYRQNNLREAMKDYNEALELDPRNRVALHNRALLRQLVGETNLALEDWDKIVSAEPKNYIARYNRALLAQRLGQPQKALDDLNVVLAQYPSFVDGFLFRSDLRKNLGNIKGAERDYWHAWDLQRNKDYRASARGKAIRNKDNQTRQSGDESIDKYNMLVEEKPVVVPQKLRYSSAARGRVQDREIQVEPQGVLYLTYFALEDPEGKPQSGSTYHADLLVQFNRRMSLAHHLRLQSQNQALGTKQIEWLQAEISTREGTDDADYYLHRGVIYSLLQDYEQAITDFDRAISRDSSLALAYFARSVATQRRRLVEASRGAEATSAASLSSTRGLASGASTQVATPVEGPALRPINTSTSVLTDLNRTIDLEPDFAYAYYNRALLYGQTGDLEAALGDYNRAIELAPRLVEAYYNRGLLYLSQGKTKEGIADLSQAGQWGLYEAYNIIKRMNQ
ncbi:MAG: tetratricopeptide repeat protein [Porphyromonadaceae bacterium]|nr:tetratricopeptide repeat protein [Porphyromonadaceae bacterium]